LVVQLELCYNSNLCHPIPKAIVEEWEKAK